MAFVRITCPHCGLAKDMAEERIPDGSVRVDCPRCRGEFSFAKAAAKATGAEPRAVAEPALTVAKPMQRQQRRDAAVAAPNSHDSTGTPSPSMGEGRGEGDKGSGGRLPAIESLLNATWAIYKRRLGVLLCLTLLALLPYLALVGLTPFLKLLFPDARQMLFAVGVFGLLVIVLCSLWGTSAAVCAVLDDDLSLRQALQKGWQHLPAFLWLVVLHAIIVAGASLLLVIPGIFLTVCFFFAQLILINEDERGLNALLKSKEYVKGYFLPVFGRLLLIWLIPLVLGILPFVGGILSLLCVPFVLVYTWVLYFELRAVRGEVAFAASGWERRKWVWVGALGYLMLPLFAFNLLGVLMSDFSPVGSLFRDKPTGEPAPAITGFLKLHDAFSRQVGMAWDVAPVSMNSRQYDEILATQKVDFEDGTRVRTGPAAILYGWLSNLGSETSVILMIRLARIPNLDLDSAKCARILIRQVLDQQGHDLLEATGDGKSEQKIRMLIKRELPTPSYETMSSIKLRGTAEESDVAAIEGEVALTLPVNIETIALDASMLGRPATAAGVTLTLRQMTGQLVRIDLEGDRTKFLKVVGYNAKNEQVTDLGSGNCCGDDSSIKVRFVDDVRTVKAYVASDFIERSYPFVLKQPRGGFSRFAGKL